MQSQKHTSATQNKHTSPQCTRHTTVHNSPKFIPVWFEICSGETQDPTVSIQSIIVVCPSPQPGNTEMPVVVLLLYTQYCSQASSQSVPVSQDRGLHPRRNTPHPLAGAPNDPTRQSSFRLFGHRMRPDSLTLTYTLQQCQ